MRTLVFLSCILSVMGLAFWAYHENYDTQQSIREVRSLNRAIGDARARINVLEAEWAYLNRPDRLRDLAEMNFDRLGLLPLMPEAFGDIEQVAYPEPLLDITGGIEVSSDNADGNGPDEEGMFP